MFIRFGIFMAYAEEM